MSSVASSLGLRAISWLSQVCHTHTLTRSSILGAATPQPTVLCQTAASHHGLCHSEPNTCVCLCCCCSSYQYRTAQTSETQTGYIEDITVQSIARGQ